MAGIAGLLLAVWSSLPIVGTLTIEHAYQTAFLMGLSVLLAWRATRYGGLLGIVFGGTALLIIGINVVAGISNLSR